LSSCGRAGQVCGSVAIIGFWSRTYMRLGMCYMTAVAAFPRFLLGYLPYTLYTDFWVDLARETTITKVKHVPDIFGHDPTVQAFVGLAYGLVIAGLLYGSIKRGMRLTGFSFKDLMAHSNDDLTIKYFDRYAKGSDDQSGEKASEKKTDDKKAGDTGYGEAVTEGA